MPILCALFLVLVALADKLKKMGFIPRFDSAYLYLPRIRVIAMPCSYSSKSQMLPSTMPIRRRLNNGVDGKCCLLYQV